MKSYKLSVVILGLVMASVSCSALAALPEPLDPRDISSMNFEQRLAHGRMIREEMNKATPDERKAYRDKMHQKMQALSFEERKSMMEILTPQERKELREERRRAFDRMNPEDRKKWRDEMHRPAKND